jgi:chemotaxis protein methyltransferase CheR
MNDNDFKQLLDVFGYSWDGYRRVRKGVKKRVARHMQALGCRDTASYIARLATDSGARQACDLLMTVSISRFFRDDRLWRALETEILPGLGEQPEIAIWSAGCACGEEVYSLSIVRDRIRQKMPGAPPITIMATDKHPDYLARAQQGVYTPSSLRNVPETLRAHYFEKAAGRKQFLVKPFLKSGIHWRHQPVDTFRVDRVFDIIFLRNNVLTYCASPRREQLLRRVLGGLRCGGYLIIGAREQLPRGTSGLVPWPSCPSVFQFRRVGVSDCLQDR